MMSSSSLSISWRMRVNYLILTVEQMDADGPSFMLPNLSNTLTKRLSTEAFSEIENREAVEVVEGSVSETSNSRPDFCLLEGEICLDNFSIRELQEAFRATFGRYTSIKDKLWLKRRIAMGLTNSCDVPSAKFFIKDNKVVLSNVKEETTRRPLSDLSDSGLVTMNRATSLLNETLGESVVDSAVLVEDMQALSNNGADKSRERCNEDNANTQMEQSIKRIRKPTKRYIEELSEVEATECSGRYASLDKTSVQDQYFFKSSIRTTCTVDTSQDLLGGYDARIPCVHRARRRRPRKNFLTLMNFVHMEGEKRSPNELNSEPLSPREEHEKFISSQDATIDENPDAVQTVVASVRRKHHRAWTLAEVLKLVEGVSRYGAGKWSEIRRLSFSSGSHRTSVDLKDKWRNLLKASFAQVPTDKGAAGSRKPTSLPIPTPILRRVRELAEKHSQSETEFVSTRFIGHGGIVQEKEIGF
ncbi:Telomere repeat-binding protein 4 [Platanthera zijinensis]|uniref:Telomere repeat-binding protein 4 n=1 Tax=Platanthera zijinensis TaxID=2320716 RepID=A0AAP0B0F1_9ASPA